MFYKNTPLKLNMVNKITKTLTDKLTDLNMSSIINFKNTDEV